MPDPTNTKEKRRAKRQERRMRRKIGKDNPAACGPSDPNCRLKKRVTTPPRDKERKRPTRGPQYKTVHEKLEPVQEKKEEGTGMRYTVTKGEERTGDSGAKDVPKGKEKETYESAKDKAGGSREFKKGDEKFHRENRRTNEGPVLLAKSDRVGPRRKGEVTTTTKFKKELGSGKKYEPQRRRYSDDEVTRKFDYETGKESVIYKDADKRHMSTPSELKRRKKIRKSDTGYAEQEEHQKTSRQIRKEKRKRKGARYTGR